MLHHASSCFWLNSWVAHVGKTASSQTCKGRSLFPLSCMSLSKPDNFSWVAQSVSPKDLKYVKMTSSSNFIPQITAVSSNGEALASQKRLADKLSIGAWVEQDRATIPCWWGKLGHNWDASKVDNQEITCWCLICWKDYQTNIPNVKKKGVNHCLLTFPNGSMKWKLLRVLCPKISSHFSTARHLWHDCGWCLWSGYGRLRIKTLKKKTVVHTRIDGSLLIVDEKMAIMEMVIMDE